ncbi:MAG: nuclear transport factor 2 family protein [Xenococcaceae cyanobacterium MO_207.B15]|nr:nuclear transport factor 2 family protein [Xenococcaceae cyanobacterium MO_207.B15]MDJ0742782.1 nuclear transport factor 2 family protein [Xenococcaceae cyanobacterium MO_167.B27]
MNNGIETQILKAEERLRLAMLNSDVNTLDQLLAPELIFTNHLGQVLSKQDDLLAHQSGIIKIKELKPSEQRIQLSGDVGIVSVRMRLLGSYADTTSDSDFRFTRIWILSSDGNWRVVAGHSSIVVS